MGSREMRILFEMDAKKQKVLPDGSELALAEWGISYQLRLYVPSVGSRKTGIVYQFPTGDFKGWSNERLLDVYDKSNSQDDFHQLTGLSRNPDL